MLLRGFNGHIGAVRELQRALDNTLRSDWFGASTSSYGAYPAINVFRKGEDYLVVAELPGADRDSLDLQVKGRIVRLSGTKLRLDSETASVHRRERATGDFDRTVSIPAEIDSENTKATYRDGMLAVYLPRAENDKPRSISID